MIPIVSITDLINGIIAAAIAVRLALMLRGYGGDRRDGLLEFIGFYAFFALFWLSFSSPDLILDTAYQVTISTIIGYVFLFIALTFVVQIPFIFFDKRWLGVIIGAAIMVLGLSYLVSRIIDPTLDTKEVIPPYIFWGEAYSPWIRIFPGIAGLLAAGTFTITFVYI